MIGILGLYLGNILEDNIENGMEAYIKGEKYNFNGGMLGDGIKKLTGGKIDLSKISYTFAQSQSKKTIGNVVAKGLVKGVANYLFNPYVIAGRMAAGAIYDSQKEYMDEQFKKEVFDLPDESNKYMIDERFSALSGNTLSSMDRTNFAVRELLNSNNIAGSLIDRAFSHM